MNTLLGLKPEYLQISSAGLTALMPYLVVLLGSVLGLLACVVRIVSAKRLTYFITLVTLVAAAVYSSDLFFSEPQLLFAGMMRVDNLSHLLNLLFIGAGLVTTLISYKYLDREEILFPEYFVLLLFSVFGMMAFASSVNVVVLFVNLEIMSLAVYCMVSFRRSDRRCNEAAVKYFVLGAVASAILLYGGALVYGATESLNLEVVLKTMNQSAAGGSQLLNAGLILLLVGILFKIASVPFHMWMPDVYEGAPTPVTGFMTTAVKAASFAALFRYFEYTGLAGALAADATSGNLLVFSGAFRQVLWVSALMTMFLGGVIGLAQTNLKRMLAYSSIAHTGYILVGFISVLHKNDFGYASIAIYLVSYALMNLGAFVVLTSLSTASDSGLTLHDLSGLSKRRPWAAFALAVFLFSMAGVPPTVGFVAKYILFYSAVQSGEILLVVLGVLCSAISAYYYLRVLVFMYMKEPIGNITAPTRERNLISGFSLTTAAVVLTIGLGLFPQALIHAAKRALEAF